LTSVRRNGEKDSPAEGRRFELSVPPEKNSLCETIVIDLRPLLIHEKK